MKIINSVSSGLSSVMMAIKMREWYPDAEIINIMANTGKEREESLEFMHKCDQHYRLNLVWVEAVINQQRRKGTDFIVRTFETLNRDGSIFEDGINKYGMPSVVNKWCNRELKLAPIHKYAKSIGWGNFGDYHTAIGIRIDEIDRLASPENIKKFNILYPLFDNGITTRLRNKFWNDQPIRIAIPDFEGNCKHCFEKTNRKQCTTHINHPKDIEWWIDMEDKYSHISLDGKPHYNKFIEQDGGHYSLRDNQSYRTIKDLSKRPFAKATDEYIYESDLFDLGGNCNTGCNIYDFLGNDSNQKK